MCIFFGGVVVTEESKLLNNARKKNLMKNSRLAFVVESPDNFGGVETIYRNIADDINLYLFKSKSEISTGLFRKFKEDTIVFNQPYSTMLFLVIHSLIFRKKFIQKKYYLVHINFKKGNRLRRILSDLFFFLLKLYKVKVCAFSPEMLDNIPFCKKKLLNPPVFKREIQLEKFSENKERIFDFLFVGRLELQKGADLLDHFAGEFDRAGFKLTVVGNGSINLENESINKIGRISQLDVFEYMSKSKVLILPSRFEGLGLVMIEAIFAGCHVVAFDCDYGPRDVFRLFPDRITLVKQGDNNKFTATSLGVIRNYVSKNLPKSFNEFSSDGFVKQF